MAIDEVKKLVTSLILRTEYISRRSLPQIAHSKIVLEFKRILEEQGSKVVLEQEQKYSQYFCKKYCDSRRKIIDGRIDILVTYKNKSIALEYDAGSYWETRSIRKLSETPSSFIVLIMGSGSIYNQYHLNRHKRLLNLKNKKGFIASLRVKEIDSIHNLLNFYKLDSFPRNQPS